MQYYTILYIYLFIFYLKFVKLGTELKSFNNFYCTFQVNISSVNHLLGNIFLNNSNKNEFFLLNISEIVI